jgi:hypothetical protein
MESINALTLQVMFGRLPFRHIVINPLDQVLTFAAVYARVQDCFDVVLVFAINAD